VLNALADGTHQLHLLASDRAGNRATADRQLVADSAPPSLGFGAPASQAFVSGLDGYVEVRATLAEANLERLDLNLTRGAATTQLATLASLPPDGLVTLWDASLEPDGPASLELVAVDRSGNEARATIPITVDNTRPVAALDTPSGPVARSAVQILGTATDLNLAQRTVSFAAGDPPTSPAFTELFSATSPVTNGQLAPSTGLPAAGRYTFRLTTTDRAGNSAVAQQGVTLLDEPPQPPSAPASLTAALVPPNSVLVTWALDPSPRVNLYRVRRAIPGSTGAVVIAELVGASRYQDSALADGAYIYDVIAVDDDGVASAPSGQASITIDTAAPTAVLTEPLSNARVGGIVAVRGTATGGANFTGYQLFLNSLEIASSTASTSGDLGSFDSRQLPEGSVQALRLIASSRFGGSAETTRSIVVDNTPPAAPVITTAGAVAARVTITWTPSSSSDVAGYLLLRNEQIANAPDGSSVADLRAWLLPATATSFEHDVVDGVHTYQLIAVDEAGNLSQRSNARSVSVDERAPQARVVTPLADSVIRVPTAVIADVDDLDVSQVQFEVRVAGATAFVPLGAPDQAPPFGALLEPAALGTAVVEVRAIATDFGGRVASTPPSVRLFAEAELAPFQVQGLVDGWSVSLSWTSPSTTSTTGYQVLMPNGTVHPAPALPAGVATASTTASGAPQAPWGLAPGSWTSHNEPEPRWEIVFDRPALVSSVPIVASPQPVIEVRLAGQWLQVGTQSGLRLDLPTLRPIEGVRLRFPAGVATVTDVDVAPHAPLTTARNHGDPSFFLMGERTYRVRAYSVFGAEREESAVARVYQPVVEPLPAQSSASPVVVRGTHATPGSTVTVEAVSGGSVLGTAVAAADGSFEIPVALAPAASLSAFVRATDGQGNRSLPAGPVFTTFTPPLAVTTTLGLISVTGGHVQLAVSHAGDAAAVGVVQLWRRAAAEPAELAAQQFRPVAFFDFVSPGQYEYYAVAFSNLGGAAPASNVVLVDVTAGEPAPTALAATSDLTAIHLTWQSPSPPSFEIERSALGAPFTLVGNATSTSFDDLSADLDVTYSYRVRFNDFVTLSPWSAVVTATRSLPLGPPLILRPPSGTSVTSLTATVEGLSRRAGVVELLRGAQRVVVAQSPTGFPAVEVLLTSIAGYTPVGPVAVASSGRRAAFVSVEQGDNAVVVASLLDPRDANPQLLPDQVAFVTNPIDGPLVFSPDGTQVAGLERDPADGLRHVFVFDTTTGTLWGSAFSAGDDDSPPLAWSADSSRLAYRAVRSGSVVIAVNSADLGLEVRRATLVDEEVRELAFESTLDASGLGLVAVIDPTDAQLDDELRSYPSSSSGSSTLYTAAALRELVVSRDGEFAAMAASAGASWKVVSIDLASTTPTEAVTGIVSPPGLAFSPDGSELAIASGQVLRVWRPGAVSIAPEEFDSASPLTGSLSWALVEGLHLSTSGAAPSLLLFGHPFSAAVSLLPGANSILARTVTPAALVSAESAPVLLTAPAVPVVDLNISATLQPPMPSQTAPAHAQLVVANAGDLAAPATVARVSVLALDGSSRSVPLVTVPALQPGASASMLVVLDLAGLTGEQLLVAVVDPLQTSGDADRANNQLTVPFTVSPSALPAITVTVTRSGDTLNAEAIAYNPGATATDLTAALRLESPGGSTVSTTPVEVFGVFSAATTRTFNRTLDLTALPSGAYALAAELHRGTALASRVTVPVTVSRSPTATVRLTANHTSYSTVETISLEALLTNTSPSEVLQGAQLEVTIRDATNAVVFGQQLTAPTLAPGASIPQGLTLPAGALGAGAFSARARVLLGAAQLADAGASFTVTGAARLQGALSVVGATTSPPRLAEGTPIFVTFSVLNSGDVAAAGVEVAASLIDPATGIVRTVTQAVGALTPGDAASGTIDLGVAPSTRTYGLTLAGRIGSGAFSVLDTTPLLVADGAAPALTINLTPGQLVQRVALVRVSAADPSGVAAVRVSVDGAAPVPLTFVTGAPSSGVWEANVAFSADGLHTLVVSAADLEGNDGLLLPRPENPVSVTVDSDGTPPQLVVSGVAHGAAYSSAIAPTLAATDAHAVRIVATLDGAPYVSGETITDGDHLLSISAIDEAFNATVASYAFTVDTLAPELLLDGAADGAQIAPPVRLSFFASDPNLASLSGTLDGVTIASGAVVTALGAHVWVVTAADALGHSTTQTRSFEVVVVPLSVSITGVSDGEVTFGPVSPVITATGAAAVSSLLNGTPFISGTAIATERTHVLTATATSAAGAIDTRTVTFAIDRTAPQLVLQGPADGSRVTDPQTLVFDASDLHLVRTVGFVDGQVFASGGTVSALGAHTWTVEAEDRAGNVARETRTFTIDAAAPVITITGVVDGELTRFDVTPVIVVTGATQVTQTLDGAAFNSGTTVSAEGTHELVVTATSAAGVPETQTVRFVIDKTPSVLALAGVADGSVVQGPLTLTFSATDLHPGSVTAVLGVMSIISGAVVSAEGDYVWRVTATDGAGNTATEERAFAIDLTPPVITVSGVSPGQVVAPPVAPTYSAADLHPGPVSATLDGVQFTSGTVVSSPGAHTLVVTAVDAAGNTASSTVDFTITAGAGNDCRVLDLIAVKAHSPPAAYDAIATFSPPIRFQLPAELVVTAGSAGGMDATLSLSFAGVIRTCIYRGGTSSYALAGCTPAAGAGAVVEADAVLLHVVDGSHASATTVARASIVEQPVCRGFELRPEFHFAACAFDDVVMSGSSAVEGSIAANRDVSLSGSAVVERDVVAGDDVSLTGSSNVLGQVYYGDQILSACLRSRNDEYQVAPPPQPCECGYDVAARLADAAAANNNNLLYADPAVTARLSNGSLVVQNATLSLAAGRYYLTGLSLGAGARLQPLPGAQVELFVNGSVDVHTNARIGMASAPPVLIVAAGPQVSLRGKDALHARVYAPAADVSLTGKTGIVGGLVVRNLSMSGSTALQLTPGPQVSPPPLTCP